MIKHFHEISNNDVLTCGGKGASLGEMTTAGFVIPEGFVLTTNAFGVNHNQRSKQAHKAFDLLGTKFVAVRSSATKEDGIEDSFAGQFDTYLFVTKENLIKQIIECQNSINTDRIKAYCKSKGINRDEIKVAIVIQKMINSEIAGVCFTKHPVTDDNEIFIEGGYGIGEAVVSGMITPDSYTINKSDYTIIKKNIAKQKIKLVIDTENTGLKEEYVAETNQSDQKLSDNHIIELSKIVHKIEKHYHKPMDIERAIEDGKLYILQARPITTNNKSYLKKIKREKILQRNFPPIAYTAGAYYEFNGLSIGQFHRKRKREILITYKDPQFYTIFDSNSYCVSNIQEIINNIK